VDPTGRGCGPDDASGTAAVDHPPKTIRWHGPDDAYRQRSCEQHAGVRREASTR
jgi:hypothetical protein